MQQKYIFGYNSLKTLFGAFLPLDGFAAKRVFPLQSNKLYIWRNSVTENYKVGVAYQQEPLDLSNLLFLRIRERQVLLNKQNAAGQTLGGGLGISSVATEDSLNKVNEELRLNV